jgi:hypothetical protein
MRSGDSYPGQQPGQRPQHGSTLADQPPTTQVDRGRNRGHGHGRRSWPTWAIAPFLGGAVVVLGIFLILQFTVLDHSSGPPKAAASAGPKVLTPAQMFPDALLEQLTKDVQTSNEQAFLSVAAPSARSAMQTWYENMQAIGYTTGLVMPAGKTDQVNLDSGGNGSTVVLAGTHSPLDPVNEKKYDVPLERYQLTLHFSGPSAIGQITGWKALGDAPWDQGKLYVRKGANLVVAGPEADKAKVDETLPIAQAAAAYDVGLINQVHATDLRQQGFVVFVSDDASTRASWFSTTGQPSGWPPAGSGYTAQLPGPTVTADSDWKLGSSIAADSTGGARVVITPWEDQHGGSAGMETAQLVQRFATAILASHDQDSFPGAASPSRPAWTVEGFGVAFEAAYYGNTNPAPDKYSFSVLNGDLSKVPPSYKTGKLPTTAQLYGGSAAAQENWLLVSGSLYASIATRYGMSQMLASAILSTIQSQWKQYLTAPVNRAPATGPNGV